MSTPLREQTKMSQATFAESTENYSLILLAPRRRNRNALLGWVMAANQETMFYALTPADGELSAFLSNLVDGLRDFDPKFGKNLTQAVSTPSATPEDYADAFLGDLAKAKPKPHYVVLDNLDYLTT